MKKTSAEEEKRGFIRLIRDCWDIRAWCKLEINNHMQSVIGSQHRLQWITNNRDTKH